MRPTNDAQQRLRHAFVVALTVNSGATDAFGFIALGGAFTSVMTGNMVLLGIAGAHADGTLAAHVGVAVVCFIAGCAMGARLAGTAQSGDPVWPAAVNRALGVELLLICGQAVGWWATGTRPSATVQLALLSANALALGIQSSTVQRFGVSGLSTTYMTGTLTTLVIRLTSGHRVRDVAGSLQILAGLVAGAVAAGLLVRCAAPATPLLQAACVVAVLIGARGLTSAAHKTDREVTCSTLP